MRCPLTYRAYDPLVVAIDAHRPILAAIESGDARAAERLSRAHTRQAATRVLRAIARGPADLPMTRRSDRAVRSTRQPRRSRERPGTVESRRPTRPHHGRRPRPWPCPRGRRSPRPVPRSSSAPGASISSTRPPSIIREAGGTVVDGRCRHHGRGRRPAHPRGGGRHRHPRQQRRALPERAVADGVARVVARGHEGQPVRTVPAVPGVRAPDDGARLGPDHQHRVGLRPDRTEAAALPGDLGPVLVLREQARDQRASPTTCRRASPATA